VIVLAALTIVGVLILRHWIAGQVADLIASVDEFREDLAEALDDVDELRDDVDDLIEVVRRGPLSDDEWDEAA